MTATSRKKTFQYLSYLAAAPYIFVLFKVLSQVLNRFVTLDRFVTDNDFDTFNYTLLGREYFLMSGGNVVLGMSIHAPYKL